MDAAAERKERLKALKEAQRLAESTGETSAGAAAEAAAAAEPEKPVLKFRNYVVKDQKIAHEQVGALAPSCRWVPSVHSSSWLWLCMQCGAAVAGRHMCAPQARQQ
jgi:coiled-coil domain-containing protein 12